MGLDEILKKLRKEYVQNLHIKIETCRQLFEGRKHRELREIFHQLKGSGTTYGLDEVSYVAQYIEYGFTHQTDEFLMLSSEIQHLLNAIYLKRVNGQIYEPNQDPIFLKVIQLLPDGLFEESKKVG